MHEAGTQGQHNSWRSFPNIPISQWDRHSTLPPSGWLVVLADCHSRGTAHKVLIFKGSVHILEHFFYPTYSTSCGIAIKIVLVLITPGLRSPPLRLILPPKCNEG